MPAPLLRPSTLRLKSRHSSNTGDLRVAAQRKGLSCNLVIGLAQNRGIALKDLSSKNVDSTTKSTDLSIKIVI